MDVEVHALGLDVAEEVDQVGQGTANPADREARDQIKIPARHSLQQVVEARPLLTPFGTRDALIEEGGHDLPVLPLGDCSQVTKLVLDGLVLIGRAHTSVDRDALGQGCSPIRCWENRLSRIGRASTKRPPRSLVVYVPTHSPSRSRECRSRPFGVFEDA